MASPRHAMGLRRFGCRVRLSDCGHTLRKRSGGQEGRVLGMVQGIIRLRAWGRGGGGG